MALLRNRTGFRRFALAIAAAQVLAYAFAPVLEAVTERAAGPNVVEVAHTKTCTPVHQPSTCMACQLLNITASKSDGPQQPATREDHARPADDGVTIACPRAPPAANLSRAPPATLA
jgi:hypothetical protein